MGVRIITTNLQNPAPVTTGNTIDRVTKVEAGSGKHIVVDHELDATSENPVQNRAIVEALDNKVDKIPGKGLSTEDYTTAEKTKLSGIATGAEVNVQSDWEETDTESDAYIKNKPDVSSLQTAVSNKMDKANPQGTGSFSMNGGSGNVGIMSSALGYACVASGNYSNAEGWAVIASGQASHAEGRGTSAGGATAHAEGQGTTASGENSHAEGRTTTASGKRSHAEGVGTIAASSSQHVQGTYNVEDANSVYAFIIGNGYSDTTRSNALAVKWNGDIVSDQMTQITEGKVDKVSGKGLSTEDYTTAEKTKLAGLTSYTAGTGIDITNGVVSLALNNADSISY